MKKNKKKKKKKNLPKMLFSLILPEYFLFKKSSFQSNPTDTTLLSRIGKEELYLWWTKIMMKLMNCSAL